ncbi:MAG: ATP-binding cassette domain-containing protein [Bacilli bacterium]
MIKLKNVSKFYYNKGIIASGFTKVNLELNLGEFVVITGESGSGKSTLLNVISGLDSYEEGEMYINGKETSHYTIEDLEKYRRTYISNIFQNFNLVNSYTVYQNIELVLLVNGKRKKDVKEKILKLIEQVGLTKYKNTKVSKLSGGQKQKVAIARALAKDTPLIIADEPTGNLDKKSASEVLKLLSKISKDKLVVVVTHNYDQVEKYATRKIRMHDGRLVEDIKLKSTDTVDNTTLPKKENITFFNKIRLGIRNSFNILPKFILLLVVYLFVFLAVSIELGSFNKAQQLTNDESYNIIFPNNDSKRIVIRKNDKQPITNEDYDKIKKIKNVDRVVKNDLILDRGVEIYKDNNYYYCLFDNISVLKEELSIGELPKSDNEVVLKLPISYSSDNIIGADYQITSYFDEELKNKKFNIVGIIYDESLNEWDDGIIYGSDYLEDILSQSTNIGFSKTNISFLDKQYKYRIGIDNRIPSGSVIIPDEFIYSCPSKNKNNEEYETEQDMINNCIDLTASISIKNLYYEETLNLKVKNVYNIKNAEKVLGFKVDDDYLFYINKNDYMNMFKNAYYQSSIFVDNEKNISSVKGELTKLGYNYIALNDTKTESEITHILNVCKLIVTIILIVVLFFISYFIIKLVMKSRNIYFSTLRILGTTKRQCRNILSIELLNISNIAVLISLLLFYFQKIKLININILNNAIKYLNVKYYIILYLIITIMSYLISIKFSNKIFKNSAMNSMQEER